MRTNVERVLSEIYRFLIVFAGVAFLVTCSTSLFVTILSTTLDISLTSDNLEKAAKLTFANVIFLSVAITLIDLLRRRLTTVRVVNAISDASKKIADGDFSVRVRTPKLLISDDLSMVVDSFNSLAEELSGLDALRGDFISDVSHEMKTPLSVMKNYASLLARDGITDEERVEYTSAIVNASDRLSAMITNVLRLNRLENQRIYPSKTRFDLSESLAECILSFEDTWEKKGILIDTELQDGVVVDGDRELLSIVWNNLLSNAFKFTEEGGAVRVVLSAADGAVTVKISDTGCGMSAGVGANIFEKFYQGDPSHATEGNGLGLALVKRVIDIVGGEIYVDSTLGQGSTFIVVLRGCV